MSRRLPVLLSADSEEAGVARPVRLIVGDTALDGRVGAWATANGFKGQKGRLLLCPDEAGEIAEALFGIVIIFVLVFGTISEALGFHFVIGAFFGAIIFGMVSIGLTYTSFDSDWFQVFLGGMLLLAVFVNRYALVRAQRAS